MGALTNPSRQYGDEYPGDFFEAACTHECRLGCYSRCEARGHCKLEVTPDRASRALSAHYDNRRGILRTMSEGGKSYVTVRPLRAAGLPTNDPVTVYITSLREDDGPDPTPFYELRAEGVPVDGPHRLTLMSLNARIEDLAPPRRKA